MKIMWRMWAATIRATCSFLGAADAPRITETIPADGALDVPIGTNVIVTFDRRMDPTTLDPARILVNGHALSDIEEVGTVMPDPQGRQVVILLRMHQDRVYGITLLPGLADMDGRISVRSPYAKVREQHGRSTINPNIHGRSRGGARGVACDAGIGVDP